MKVTRASYLYMINALRDKKSYSYVSLILSYKSDTTFFLRVNYVELGRLYHQNSTSSIILRKDYNSRIYCIWAFNLEYSLNTDKFLKEGSSDFVNYIKEWRQL